MRSVIMFAVALVACGGKFADDGDGGASFDAHIDNHKPEAQPPIDANPPPGLGINVSGDGPGFESEDQIAVAPDGTIAILWSAFTTGGSFVTMEYAFSTDDGKSFTPPVAVAIPSGLLPGDPAITVDAAGNFHAAYLGIKYSGQGVDYSRVYVATSPKGAQSFGAPIEISAPGNTTDLNDHPKIFVTTAGTLLVAWADFPSFTAPTSVGTVARSVDGTTWSRTTVVGAPEATFANLFWFCEGSLGIYTTFLELTPQSAFVGIRASTDDGATWATSSTQVSLVTDQIAGLDPICVASGANVSVIYTTTQNPSLDESTLDGADQIFIAHSGDGATTFDPLRIDVIDHTKSALATIPLAAIESSGTIDVAYVGGAAQDDSNASVRFTRTSFPSAASPSQLVDGPMLFDLSRTSQTWVGDYFGGVVHSGALYLAYPNNASGLDHIEFRKLALP